MRVPRTQTRSSAGTIALVAAATAIYYVLPVPGAMRENSWAVMFFLGAAVLGALILTAIRRLLRAGENARIRGLILLLTLTVLFFSWSDESVARLPGQFTLLSTKTDSLYFNVSTLATVGFGDVHPVGQLARAAVTVQIVFNLVFLGAAVSLITGFFRTRARGHVQGAQLHGSQIQGAQHGPEQAGTEQAGTGQAGTGSSAGSEPG
ncbi:MAG TPA: potassium channel family protein [Streptosporangiaceae bacterium]|nr:potassium channel family protein [Streptosporangiaceae bacterium]